MPAADALPVSGSQQLSRKAAHRMSLHAHAKYRESMLPTRADGQRVRRGRIVLKYPAQFPTSRPNRWLRSMIPALKHMPRWQGYAPSEGSEALMAAFRSG
jgi:hypothetical protein